ncbi:MAG: acetoacetyl-CoA reductase [Oceanospirillaceae bacterium]|nr:acetoacetyl-CoA reductase [Oceanospirillaceae bacterium]|tara:strand:+ start:61 stop:2358 length:2298 start_codon:yes stop_codon:yes gene_type:complete
MSQTINKVAVIGAGTMGAGIAGQVANAGVEVWLLDLASEDENVNAVAERGLERLHNPDSPGLMSKEAESRIHIGNIRDDFDQLADCDWIAEAVVERLDIKQDLYRRIEAITNDQTIVTSNTSTIPISLLTEGMSAAFCERFAITHFFNPVRFMRLLELVRGEQTRQEVMDTLDAFCEQRLGKGVVVCADTPGFLGNRVGVFAIQCALHEAVKLGLSPAEADAIFGRPMGIPKTGVFGLYDLIGIDLMADVAKSLETILPASDAFHQYAQPLDLMTTMIANGQTGNKGGKGFYRDTDNGREVLALATNEYQSLQRLQLPLALQAEAEGVGVLLQDQGKYGQFAWRVLSSTLNYAAHLLPEVGHNIVPIDDAMKLGYNWIYGPFELLDQIGVDYFISRMQSEGRTPAPFLLQAQGQSFYSTTTGQLASLEYQSGYTKIERTEGVLRFSELRQTLTPINSNAKASWWVFNNAAIVEFHSKANALDDLSMTILMDALQQAKVMGLDGVVVHNDAQHFSCGVNLVAFRELFEASDWAGMDKFLHDFQQTVLAMRQSDLPVVAACAGMSIGGGFEVVLHADKVICHGNSVMGLVESGVGVVPGGGGCKETLYRWFEKTGDMEKAAWKAFMNLGYGRTATSPIEATDQAMIRADDSYLMNRDRILSSALGQLKDVAKTPAREPLAMVGQPVFAAMQEWLTNAHSKGILTPHECTVGTEMARIVTGGDIAPGTIMSEQDLFNAERDSFLRLAKTPETQERIVTMLDLGSPLRN